MNQRYNGQAAGGHGSGLRDPFERGTSGQLGASTEQGRRPGEPAEKEIAGDFRRTPDRRVDDRLPVIRAEPGVGHHRLLGPRAVPTSSEPAAAASIAAAAPVLAMREYRTAIAAHARSPLVPDHDRLPDPS